MSATIIIGFKEDYDAMVPRYKKSSDSMTDWIITHEAAKAFFKVVNASDSDRQVLGDEIIFKTRVWDWSQPWNDPSMWLVPAEMSEKMLNGILQVKKARKESVVIDGASAQATLGKLEESGILCRQKREEFRRAFDL